MNQHPLTFIFIGLFGLFSCTHQAENVSALQEDIPHQEDWAIAIHGGAGNFDTARFSREDRDAYARELQDALDHGKMILSQGGDALDVVEHVIRTMEDSPYFNAGRGAVFTSTGENELDASIMDGRDLNCGSVSSIQNIRNPISAARAVMELSPHVFLSGQGATSFALENGLEWADSSYFKTDKKWNRYLELRGEELALFPPSNRSEKFGTVGCVVLDMNGHLAAGTSTGGMMMKKNGRIGDSPIVGAGTYADDRSCAVSCTGHGEYFIRAAVAHEVSARMRFGASDLKSAGDEVILNELVKMGGEGGLISVDHFGNVHMPFNTSGMYRAYATSSGEEKVAMMK